MLYTYTVETKPKAKSKAISNKNYIQYSGKEIKEDDLVERFETEWCKKYKINQIKNLNIYFNIEDKKAYFVVNGSISIIIDFE